MKRIYSELVEPILFSVMCISLIYASFAKAEMSDKNAQLIQAAEKGNLQTVQTALANGADVNAKNIYGQTSLMIASVNGYTEIVRLLLEKGADVNAREVRGTIALMYTAGTGMHHTEIVKLLFEKGTEANAKTNNNKMAVEFAKSKLHETSLGTLRTGFDIEKDTEIKLTMNAAEIVFVFLKIQEGQALPLDGDIEVFPVHRRTPEPSVTLVQDKTTGKWLATSGVLATDGETFGLVEGHIVKIIGGTRDPIKIGGYFFANSVIIIREGKPVKQEIDITDSNNPKAQQRQYDEQTRIDGLKRGKEMGYNPIIIFIEKDGNISILKDSIFSEENGKFATKDNDLLINAGDRPATIFGVTLSKGEGGIIKDGKCTKTNIKFGTDKDTIAQGTKSETKPKYLLPAFSEELQGSNPVRVKNPNSFAVSTGLRSGQKGKNFDVAANGVEIVYVPDGKYDIYFVYSDKPDALFQGDSFTLNDDGVEIQIVQVVNGNYNIRQVK